MNHVFVDFENVQQIDDSLVGANAVSFTLMMGPNQTKLDTDLVERLVKHAASVKVVRMKSSAKDAVDIALAYYLGQAALAEPASHFHILSKDRGYDPLITHLRKQGIKVWRRSSCADLAFTWPGKAAPVAKKAIGKKAAKKTAAKKATSKAVAKKAMAKKAAKKKVAKISTNKIDGSLQTWTEKVVNNLTDHPKARPAKDKTLHTKVGDLIKKPVDGPEVQSVIDRMQADEILKFDEKGVIEYLL